MSIPIEISNWEIFLWSLYKLGGTSEYIDVELVFLECFALAPNRLSWRTRKDIPDLKKCSKGLRDAEAREPKMLVKTADGLARQLSVNGQKWIKENYDRLSTLLETSNVVQEPRQRPNSRMLAEVENCQIYRDWEANDHIPSQKWKIAEILRCSPDSQYHTWFTRLENLRSIAYAADKKRLLEFLNQILSTHPEWFGGKGQ